MILPTSREGSPIARSLGGAAAWAVTGAPLRGPRGVNVVYVFFPTRAPPQQGALAKCFRSSPYGGRGPGAELQRHTQEPSL